MSDSSASFANGRRVLGRGLLLGARVPFVIENLINRTFFCVAMHINMIHENYGSLAIAHCLRKVLLQKGKTF